MNKKQVGRPKKMHEEKMYTQVKNLIEPMKIGEVQAVKKPENIIAYRKYITEIALKSSKKFITKVIDGKLHIMRVEYFNINMKYKKEN